MKLDQWMWKFKRASLAAHKTNTGPNKVSTVGGNVKMLFYTQGGTPANSEKHPPLGSGGL